jgi:hypothetical protein
MRIAQKQKIARLVPNFERAKSLKTSAFPKSYENFRTFVGKKPSMACAVRPEQSKSGAAIRETPTRVSWRACRGLEIAV